MRSVITVANPAGVTLPAGTRILPGYWPAGFDHAGLVALLRSRADGYDFRLRHSSLGLIPFSVADLNTSGASIVFDTVAAIGAGGTDDGYSLEAGDLSLQASPFTAPAGAAPPSTDPSVTISVPALAMPEPSYQQEVSHRWDVDADSYPDALAPLRSARNQNPRRRLRLLYSHVTGSDWYGLRAFVVAQRGAGAFPSPSWMAEPANWIVLQATYEQRTRLSYHATVEMEEVVL